MPEQTTNEAMAPMNDSQNNTRPPRRDSEQGTQQRKARRVTRSQRQPKRSVGASSLAAPAAHAIGLAGSRSLHTDKRPQPASKHSAPKHSTARDESAKPDYEVRPAVYTREEHKRSASRHHTARSESSEADFEARPALYIREEPKLSLRDRISKIDLSAPWIPIALLVTVTLAICVVMLYSPVRTYYAAWRDSCRLEIAYNVVKDQNSELNHEISRLQSREGIEDEARRRGYVHSNEEALVTDVPPAASTTDPEVVNQKLAAYEEQQPWYIHTLDSLLGYSYEQR